jgi:hypothetical protein
LADAQLGVGARRKDFCRKELSNRCRGGVQNRLSLHGAAAQGQQHRRCPCK